MQAQEASTEHHFRISLDSSLRCILIRTSGLGYARSRETGSGSDVALIGNGQPISVRGRSLVSSATRRKEVACDGDARIY